MSTVTLYVGTYDKAGGKGLERVVYDTATGFTRRVHNPNIANASFGVRSAKHDLQYLVNEQSDGMLGIYRRAPGEWQKLGALSSEGREPCYVALAPDERHIAVANYASGSIALIGLGADGLPDGRVAVWANDGCGPNRERQDAPHMHCVRFSADGEALLAVDLGTDQILRFAIDDALQLKSPEVAWQAPPGSGPRHLLFHPTHALALLVSELDSTLTLFETRSHALSPFARCTTVPIGAAGENLGGHLELDRAGTRVYVTNRGHDSIATFALDPAAGTLAPIQHVSSCGASPRYFLLLEGIGRLIVVNEEAGILAAFAIEEDGRLAPTSHVIDVAGAAFAFVETAEG